MASDYNFCGDDMRLDGAWFTEEFKDDGAAFSLKIRTKVHEEKTPYQHIEIYDTAKFGYLMVIDGFVMLTTRDNFIYHEMLSHPALFTHVAPKRVLIIGGGDCGTLREVLKHPDVKEAWQVEIDERVTRLAEHYFPELCESNNDPRANFYFGDGIEWLKAAKTASFDIVIIDSTDPVGPAKGLFVESFYRDCLRVLKDDGIAVQQSESPLFHQQIIIDMRNAMLRAGFANIHTLNFPQCVYPSGWWSATLASKSSVLTRFRNESAIDKPFATRYYNAAIHQAALAQPEFFAEFI